MDFLKRVYLKMYPEQFGRETLIQPILGLTLFDVRLRPVNSSIMPSDVNLISTIGNLSFPVPIFSAAMDTVTGPKMAMTLAEMGGCGVIYRHKEADIQLAWIKEALAHQPCLVANPRVLRPEQKLEAAKDILEQYGFSTIPVVSEAGILVGIVFTRDISWRGHLDDSVNEWMIPTGDLKIESPETPFSTIKDRLLNEQRCSVLPIVDSHGVFKGIYFMKDFFNVNPAWNKDKIAVGMAVGVGADDLARVRKALDLGVGTIVIDSSHGDCDAVIEQTKKIVDLVDGQAVVVAGNVADPGGYYRLALAGANAVKCGIGSGSICTTSQVTGAAFPMFSLIRELDFTRKEMKEGKYPTPAIIADGGVNGPGDAVIALAAGANGCMAGQWLVAAHESQSCQDGKNFGGKVTYRGMASEQAIEERLANRYDIGKSAPEGVTGSVPYRGLLKKWFGKDLELVRGGFAHVGARNITELQSYCDWPLAFVRFTSRGQSQIEARV
jgi:IMP dehydrogenase